MNAPIRHPDRLRARRAPFAARRAVLVLALAAGFGATAPAQAHQSPTIVSSHLATVEIVDRNDGVALPVYTSGGERWIVGTPGHEYAIRIRNATGERILAVPSVDGVNAITGETAAPHQSGYVLEPYGFVEIAGWRKSLSNTAAFYFTDVSDSYAARTGRPSDLGVIGIAVFREQRRIAWTPPSRIADARSNAANAPMARESAAGREEPAPAAAAGVLGKSLESADVSGGWGEAKRRDSRLGTGHGRSETSHAQRVAFERASAQPESVVAIRYDRRENLVARGIAPGPWYAGRTPAPFPGWTGFAPNPR